MARFWIRDWMYMCDFEDCNSEDNALEHLPMGSERPTQKEADKVMREQGWQIGKTGVFCPSHRTDGQAVERWQDFKRRGD